MNRLALIILITAGCLFLATSVLAQPGPTADGGYRLSVPIPGFTGTVTQVQSLPDYIRLIYQFALVISGILAFGMITYGGILYTLSAGNIASQQEATSVIRDAVVGLILLFAAVLILRIIDPNILRFGRGVSVVESQYSTVGVNNASGFLGKDTLLRTEELISRSYGKEKQARDQLRMTIGPSYTEEDLQDYLDGGELTTPNWKKYQQEQKEGREKLGIVVRPPSYDHKTGGPTRDEQGRYWIYGYGDVEDPLNNGWKEWTPDRGWIRDDGTTEIDSRP